MYVYMFVFPCVLNKISTEEKTNLKCLIVGSGVGGWGDVWGWMGDGWGRSQVRERQERTRPKIFSISSCIFFEILAKSYVGATPGGLTPHYGES